MIPKIVHYVWMGGASKSEEILRYIETWRKYFPDYKFIEWNESNFDINQYEYTRQAYENKKWAFVSDVVRTYALYNYGGIYMDTDLELVNDPTRVIGDRIIIGYETRNLLETCFIAAPACHEIFKRLLNQYETEQFCCGESFNSKTINHRLSNLIFDYIGKRYLPCGNYQFDDINLYDTDIFTGSEVTDNTISIHHFSGSWKMPVELTRSQYFVFRVKQKLLHLSASLIGNIKFNDYDAKQWQKALEITKKNKQKHKRIYKKL